MFEMFLVEAASSRIKSQARWVQVEGYVRTEIRTGQVAYVTADKRKGRGQATRTRNMVKDRTSGQRCRTCTSWTDNGEGHVQARRTSLLDMHNGQPISGGQGKRITKVRLDKHKAHDPYDKHVLGDLEPLTLRHRATW